jgi:hypothetical protein
LLATIRNRLGTHRFQRAGVNRNQLRRSESLEPIRMLAIDKHITQAKPIRARLMLINASLAETARWKRCEPRLAPINVLIAKIFYLHSFQLNEECAN